jgi:hypothetical protein
LPQALIEEILEAFNQHTLSETQACEMLGIKRARLYRLERHYLQARLKGGRSSSMRRCPKGSIAMSSTLSQLSVKQRSAVKYY